MLSQAKLRNRDLYVMCVTLCSVSGHESFLRSDVARVTQAVCLATLRLEQLGLKLKGRLRSCYAPN
jgi:hypothetical protein